MNMDMGYTRAWDKHGHRINTGMGSTRAWKHGHRSNMGTRSTWAWKHGHGSNMGTGTWAWEQHGHGINTGMGTWAQDSSILQLLDSQGSGGGAPGKLETRCCRNEVSEAHLRAEGTGRKLVLYMKGERFVCL